MIRKIVKIDRELCNGCGACAKACHEGAIVMSDGKATVVREDYCDGLGNCLPACPAGAITIEEREAVPFDEQAVKNAALAKEAAAKVKAASAHLRPTGCPGSQIKRIQRDAASETQAQLPGKEKSALSQWPVQIKLAPANAPWLDGADILVAADCTAYAYAAFHSDFIAGRITLVGCPKLDGVDYSEKLAAIFAANIRSVTVVRMEVPCCGGLENAVRTALENCGKCIPWQIVTLALDGTITDRRP